MNKGLTNTVFDRFRGFILRESGLDFKDHHKKTLEEKCRERMGVCGVKTHEEYLNFLMFTIEGPQEFKSLLDLLTVGETYFFRNKPQFEGLREYVVPALQAWGTRKLKIWCAGCSTGEEPYTLAMLLRETAPLLRFSILATDINRRSLTDAKRGVYSKRSIRNLEAPMLKTYFKRQGSEYKLSDEIKNEVNFVYHNLASSEFSLPEMQDLDILVCRNVTIYFDEQTLKRVIGKFVPCISPGGFLFIGHAETLRGISDEFKVIQRPGTIIYEKKSSLKALEESTEIEICTEDVERGKKEELPPPPPEERRKEPCRRENMLVRAGMALERKEYSEAILFVDKHLNGNPDDSKALMLKGEILGNQRFFKDALNIIDRAIETDNLSIRGYCLKGTLLADMGKYDEALLQFKRVLYLEPDNCISHYYLGNMYRHLGEITKAIKEYSNCHTLLKRVDSGELIPLSQGVSAAHLHTTVVNALKELKAGRGT